MPSYRPISSLPHDFTDPNASAADALAVVWRERFGELQSSIALQEFNEKLYRRWAIETGILEKLYSLDRGVTQILVERGLDISLIDHTASDIPATELIAILKDHRETVQFIMDFVSGDSKLTLHFIRSLHQILTRHQDYVDAVDQFGRSVKFDLIKGGWKKHPNNPTRPDGMIHYYCPPEFVDEQMQELIDIYVTMADMPTVIRSAWIHHRFTQIHPFQDGNGRVARALAAFVFAKDHLFPIVVDRDQRPRYIDCLEQADRGDIRPLIAMWSELQTQAIQSALSLADSILTDDNKRSDWQLREKLFGAISARAKERKQQILHNQSLVFSYGDEVFDGIIVPEFYSIATSLTDVMRESDPNFLAHVEVSDESNKHWFKFQIVSLADKYKYFCDLQTYHRWIRLKLKHSIIEEESDELVLSIHSLGRNFSGVLALSGYFAERELDADGRSFSGPIHDVSDGPLSFTYNESSDEIVRRVQNWLEMAINVSLELFRKEI
jgi:Fic/DOC family